MKKYILLGLFVLLSFAAYSQWKIASTNNSLSVSGLAFPSPNAAYIITNHGGVYISTDVGVTWQQLHAFGPFSSAGNIKFINSDTGYVFANGGIYRTVDGGNAWVPISGSWIANKLPLTFVKITGQKLYSSYVSNDTVYLIRSDNYGTNWQVLHQKYEVNAKAYVFDFVDSLNGYLINPNNLQNVYKTTDGGQTFDTLLITTGDIVLQEKYDFKDLQNGYLYGSRQHLSYPGRTWNTGTFYYPIDLDGFGALPVFDLDFRTNKLYASSLYGKIFYSTSNGQTWTEQATPINDPIYYIEFVNDSLGIAVGTTAFLHTKNGGFISVQNPDNSQLINVYPNPVNSVFKIDIPTNIKIQKIVLYNLMGQKIRNFNPKQKSYNVNKLDAGVYVLSVFLQDKVINKKIVIR